LNPSESAGARDRLDGERRQLTMLFCDVVDSTGLSERQDPEDVREILQAYQKACIGEIVRFGGEISHYAGDGMMAQFG
jgi:class 3 adenylate cyclase